MGIDTGRNNRGELYNTSCTYPAPSAKLPMYTTLIRPLLFQLDPETAHQLAIATVKTIGYSRPLQHLVRNFYHYGHPALTQTLWGISFPNPLGLAAGFDKNGEGVLGWAHLGFGFAEIGTVTAHPQSGNPRPRLFRLPADSAILNRMGFNNQGAVVIAERLQQYRTRGSIPIPIGINLGKSRITPLPDASADYMHSFQLCHPLGDYFVINVSSPNTEGLRSLQAVSALTEIITTLQAVNHPPKPLLVKIAPDLSFSELEDILAVCLGLNIAGIIATNTTTDRSSLTDHKFRHEAGGISGVPLRSRSTEIIKYIYRATQGKLPIIGVGGINSVNSAWEKLTAGASLLEIYTGLVYEGLGVVPQILKGIVQRMAEVGVAHLQMIVGTEA